MSPVSIQFCTVIQFCTALHALLMMTAECMLSKRTVSRFAVVLLFLLKLFSSDIYCIPIYLHKIANIMITDKAYARAYLGGRCAMAPPFDSVF